VFGQINLEAQENQLKQSTLKINRPQPGTRVGKVGFCRVIAMLLSAILISEKR